MFQLKCLLSNNTDYQLSMFWLAIKDPHVSSVVELPDIVHQVGCHQN